MDFFSDIWSSVTTFFLPIKNEAAPTERTVAPFNIHPIQFDITLKPVEESPSIDLNVAGQIDVKPPPELQHILDTLLNSLGDDTPKTIPLSINDHAKTIPGNIGQTFFKVVEDATGQTIEVIQETVTDISTTAENGTNGVFLNSNITETNQSNVGEANYINIYIIAILLLILILAICTGVFYWCKKNRLKAEKRNNYPITAVVNHEYMDPQMIKNNQKLKDLS